MALELAQAEVKAPVTAIWRGNSGTGVRLSNKDRVFFTEQLALLLDTGANLHSGLLTLSRQSANKTVKSLIDDIAEHISGGRSFSEALARHPQSFSTTYVNLVEAGEGGGFLPRVLDQLLKMEERREKLRSEVVSALSYPVFLMGFSMAVVIFVLVVVFPKFDAMFSSIADQLPPTTRMLMAASEIMRTNYIAIFVFLAALIALLAYWAKSESGRNIIDRVFLYAPVIRSVFVPLYIVQSLRVMSLSLGNGVSVPDTLGACREVVSNKGYISFIHGVEKSVQDGAGITAGFRKADFMPDIVKEMIATGEDGGALPKVMDRVASYYETDLEKRLGALSRMAEPVMLIVMGLIVGILVSSLILPIFQLSRAVG